jgi:hypothetical protein
MHKSEHLALIEPCFQPLTTLKRMKDKRYKLTIFAQGLMA